MSRNSHLWSVADNVGVSLTSDALAIVLGNTISSSSVPVSVVAVVFSTSNVLQLSEL